MRRTLTTLLLLAGTSTAAAQLPSNPAVQRILNAQELRIPDDKVMLDSIRYRTSTDTSRLAILAAGRIGSPQALELFTSILNKKDSSLKPLAAFAMSLLPNPTAPVILTQNLPMHRDPELKKWLIRGIGRSGGEKQLAVLAGILTEEKTVEFRAAAAEAMGMLWAGPSEKWAVPAGALSTLVEYSKEPMPLSLTASFALARYKGDAALIPADDLIKALSQVKDTYALAYLTRVLSRLKTPKVAPVLRQLIGPAQPLAVRVEAAKTLASFSPAGDIGEAVKLGLTDGHTSVLVATIESVANYGELASGLIPTIHSIFQLNTSNWVRSVALKTLTRIRPATYREWVVKILNATYAPITPAAIQSVAFLETASDRDLLADWILSPLPGAANAALEVIQLMDSGKVSPKMKDAMLKALDSTDPARVSLIADAAALHKWRQFAPVFEKIFPQLTHSDHIESRLSIVKALGVIGDAKQVPFLKTVLADPYRPVVQAASDTIQKLSGEDVSSKIPLNSKVTATPPSIGEINAATSKTVALKTNRGTIRIRTLEEAPMTSFHFIKLVKEGFYDGKTFHRVVPNFVVQGGDPRGDGFGGPGYFIRDEVSWRPHDRRAVGIATAGKDTGGSQFFINLAPNPHLNGKYTLFGEVVAGMDIVDRLEVGDQILTAKVEP